MSKNVTLWGASYTNVPALDVPQTGGGTARFIDPSPTTATAADVTSGKTFFAADGTQTTGTNSGGGGSNDFVVTLTKVNGTWTPDCTYADFMTAYNGGKNMVFYAGANNAAYGNYYASEGGVFYIVYEEDSTSYNDWSTVAKGYAWTSSGVESDGDTTFWETSTATATAADVANGKRFYGASGYAVGTASGGGATNFVEGTFTTPSTAGVSSFTIPYTGSGYPIMAYIVVDGGAYVSGTDWYTSMQRYAIGVWSMSKSVWSSTPTYTTSGSANQAVTTAIYKNSTSSSTSYTRTSAMTTNTFSSSNASNAAATTIRFKTGNVLSYYTNTSSYGLLPETTYHYFIVYSS